MKFLDYIFHKNITEQAPNAADVVGKVLIDVSNPSNNHLNINFNSEFGVTATDVADVENYLYTFDKVY